MLKKPRKDLKIAILLPCYKRNQYTLKCAEALDRGKSGDYTVDYYTVSFPSLRETVIQFIESTRGKYDFIGKIDNDCLVPNNWIDDILDIFEQTDVDILSPNVLPSNAAYELGQDSDLPYRPSKYVGGLWFMRSEIVEGINFKHYDVTGIKAAFAVIKQIIVEKDPLIGWAHNVNVEDMGHWSGKHKDHIKSEEHKQYSKEVGREIAWQK